MSYLLVGLTIIISGTVLGIVPNLAYGGLDEYQNLQNWANTKSINLIGVNKDSNHLTYFGYDANIDKIELNKISGVIDSIDILYNLPDNIISSISEKTIYFSTEKGRSLTIIYSMYEQIPTIPEGIILEQPIDQYYLLHEIGHFVYLDIKQDINKNPTIKSQKEKLFEIDYNNHNGFVNFYSLINEHENFAEHFAYYVSRADEFRELAGDDKVLKQKYEFLKLHIFNNIEF